MRWEELRYRPYFARHGGAEIIVIPRDRELSDAQLSGMDPGWFENEVVQRTKGCDFPALVTTWTDGDNGGWFRTPDLPAGFWGHFFLPIAAKGARGARWPTGRSTSRNTLIAFRRPRRSRCTAAPGTPGPTGAGTSCSGRARCCRKRAGTRFATRAGTTARCWGPAKPRQAAVDDPAAVRQLIADAYDCILRAETSCNFYWGSAWVHKSFDDLEQAYHLLDTVKSKLPGRAER